MAYLHASLSAGLSAPSAWRELAREFPGESALERVVEGIDQGRAIHELLEQIPAEGSRKKVSPWPIVGALWQLSRVTGAPRGPMLHALSVSLAEAEATRRAIDSALATPRATLRLIAVMPVVSVAASSLAGVGDVGLLFRTPLGLSILAFSMAMMAGAWWWVRLASERVSDRVSGLSIELDMFAAATAAGLPPERTRAALSVVMEQWGLPCSTSGRIESLIALSRRAGVPISSLARLHAELERRHARLQADDAIGRLQVAVVLPLGLLLLPGFVLIAIAPVILGWVGSGT